MDTVQLILVLIDEFKKIDNSKLCIERLSRMCIPHRSKAEQVVATWDTQFQISEIAQKISLLYLANEVMQKSKREGNEFVTEFWRVLPGAMKVVNENGEDHGKCAVSRLVDIWDERRIFGSLSKSLKEIMLADEVTPPLKLKEKGIQSVAIEKKDEHSIRTKLSIGGTPENIVLAFPSDLVGSSSKDAETKNYQDDVNRVKKIADDIDVTCTNANDPKWRKMGKELKDEETIFKEHNEAFKSTEAKTEAVSSQLREALEEQEARLDKLRAQIQEARKQTEEVGTMQENLRNDGKTSAELAGELADKLLASTASQHILTSVLSKFAAEEAQRTAGLTNSMSQSTRQIQHSGANIAAPYGYGNQPMSEHLQQLQMFQQQQQMIHQQPVPSGPQVRPPLPPPNRPTYYRNSVDDLVYIRDHFL